MSKYKFDPSDLGFTEQNKYYFTFHLTNRIQFYLWMNGEGYEFGEVIYGEDERLFDFKHSDTITEIIDLFIGNSQCDDKSHDDMLVHLHKVNRIFKLTNLGI